jgi:hypothetical protein
MRRLDKPPNNAPTAVARVGCGANGLRYVKLKCNLEIDEAAGFAKPPAARQSRWESRDNQDENAPLPG